MILFHGEGKVYEKELPKYHPGVVVEFNTTAYMNEGLFRQFIEQYLMPALDYKPSLFAMDLCSSYNTHAVLDLLRSGRIMPTFIIAGCTGLFQ